MENLGRLNLTKTMQKKLSKIGSEEVEWTIYNQ